MSAVSAVLLLSLAGLALLDSTSVGTLFIPIWLLLAPTGVRAGRLLSYLGTIAAFYLVVGLGLALGGSRIGSALGSGSAQRPLLLAQLAIGVILFGLSFWVKKRQGAATARLLRWRERAVTGAASSHALVGLALFSALAEVATMLPYLGAIGMVTTAELPHWSLPVVLGGYCIVMILPALVLFAVRSSNAARIDRVLERLNTWFAAKGAGTLSWILGIAGFLVARDAAARLWFPQLFGGS